MNNHLYLGLLLIVMSCLANAVLAQTESDTEESQCAHNYLKYLNEEDALKTIYIKRFCKNKEIAKASLSTNFEDCMLAYKTYSKTDQFWPLHCTNESELMSFTDPRWGKCMTSYEESKDGFPGQCSNPYYIELAANNGFRNCMQVSYLMELFTTDIPLKYITHLEDCMSPFGVYVLANMPRGLLADLISPDYSELYIGVDNTGLHNGVNETSEEAPLGEIGNNSEDNNSDSTIRN